MISLEEYLSSMYHPDCEWLEGELIERNMGEPDHAGTQALVTMMLGEQRRTAGVHVFTELRVQIDERRFRIPDILVTTHRIKGRVLREPPFLCIEIVSPEDRMSRMEAKINEFLLFGVPYVWLIDPREKRAWVYTAAGRQEALDHLRTSSPDLTLSLGEIFAELEEDVEAE